MTIEGHCFIVFKHQSLEQYHLACLPLGDTMPLGLIRLYIFGFGNIFRWWVLAILIL